MSKKRRVATGRSWPLELDEPFPWWQLNDQAAEKFFDGFEFDHELAEDYATKLREAETRRRVALLAKFLGRPWPESEVDWLRLIFKVCISTDMIMLKNLRHFTASFFAPRRSSKS